MLPVLLNACRRAWGRAPAEPAAAGAWAEARVARRLLLRGWRLAAWNWTGGGGELDLVASRWRTLLIAEVRYRAAGEALQSIDAAKLDRVLAATEALIRQHSLEAYRVRIDLYAVDPRGRISRQRDILRAGALR
jgi:putative endonuclease